MYSLSFCVSAIALLLRGLTLIHAYSLDGTNNVKSSRSADTCADPSLAETVFQVFIPSHTVHALNFRWAFEDANTRAQAVLFADLQLAFLAWPTQQNFTIPLFRLETADSSQITYRIGTDAQTPPIVSGFPSVALIAWVYDSQVCSSVPLMGTTLAAFTDDYYTISAFEHNSLVSAGWVDTGVVAFVLPLYSS